MKVVLPYTTLPGFQCQFEFGATLLDFSRCVSCPALATIAAMHLTTGGLLPCPANSLARTPIVKADPQAGGCADLDDRSPVLRYAGMEAGARAANLRLGAPAAAGTEKAFEDGGSGRSRVTLMEAPVRVGVFALFGSSWRLRDAGCKSWLVAVLRVYGGCATARQA